METLVPATRTQILEMPALRRTLLRGTPAIWSVQRGKHEPPARTFQGSALLKVRRGFHGSGYLLRISFHPITPMEHRNQRWCRISAYRVRTLPMPALRRTNRRRKQELHRPHQSGGITGVHDKMINNNVTIYQKTI